ncbi:MAG: ABC transporter substrate-binding protein, partial [Gemmatimonadales bacterium]
IGKWLADTERWGDYEMPLETIDDAPWGLAVRHGEHRLYGIVSEMIQKWHGSGRILELETKWSVKNTPFAKRMHTKYK